MHNGNHIMHAANEYAHVSPRCVAPPALCVCVSVDGIVAAVVVVVFVVVRVSVQCAWRYTGACTCPERWHGTDCRRRGRSRGLRAAATECRRRQECQGRGASSRSAASVLGALVLRFGSAMNHCLCSCCQCCGALWRCHCRARVSALNFRMRCFLRH